MDEHGWRMNVTKVEKKGVESNVTYGFEISDENETWMEILIFNIHSWLYRLV